MTHSRQISHASLSRRGFMSAAFGAAALSASRPAVTLQPILRTGSSHMKLSLAAYSFNSLLLRRPKPEQLKNAPMVLEEFVRFCAKMELDGCEPTAYYFPETVTDDYLMGIKEQAFRLGLDISGTAIGNNFCLPQGSERSADLAMTREWIDHAAALGAPVIRIFAGKTPQGDTEEAALERCIEGINESLEYAAQKGVFLALENHGGITATPEQLLRIVNGVAPSPWFGVNFDSGNFQTADPYGDLAKIAPFAINAQIKVMISPNGKKEPADFSRIIAILRDAGYRGYVVLEYEEKNPLQEIPNCLDRLRKAISSSPK